LRPRQLIGIVLFVAGVAVMTSGIVSRLHEVQGLATWTASQAMPSPNMVHTVAAHAGGD
jgi:hypothetical protein